MKHMFRLFACLALAACLHLGGSASAQGRGTYGTRGRGGETVVVAARITVRPDSVEAFIGLCKPLIEKTRRDKGCLRYELYQDPARPDIFFFYEEYADAAAKEYHARQEYMGEYRVRREPMLAAPPFTRVYKAKRAM